ncbi:conserved hypothetical protein [Trichinella spiralis]|uniref:hypothetical protein n=1 Tax=Trichinella spiralis TaxID=6334 RepID=UPI0001EFBF0B|nr:conserved hypothetical protein [Trichinella spiralis]
MTQLPFLRTMKKKLFIRDSEWRENPRIMEQERTAFLLMHFKNSLYIELNINYVPYYDILQFIRKYLETSLKV